MKHGVSLIIPIYNAETELIRFWSRLHSNAPYEVILIDNASDTTTKAVLRVCENRPQQDVSLCVVTNTENTGFGPANNQGAALAEYDTLVFTQTDVEFHRDVLSDVLVQVDGHDDLFGARLLDYNTGWNTFGDQTFPYLEGWFLACHKDTWDRIGGFDPRYVPADFEDVDLATTAISKGVALKQLNVAVQHNHPGKSWETSKLDRQQVTIRNQQLFKQKWGL